MQWLFHAYLWEEKQLRQDFIELKKFVLKLASGAAFSPRAAPHGACWGTGRAGTDWQACQGGAQAQSRSALAATTS